MEPIKETVSAPKESLREKIKETIVVRTEMESYISDIINSQPQTADDIQVKDLSYGEGKHRLSLPEAVEKKYGKKYGFRWVNKKKEWLDRATNVRGWLIVNRTLFSDLPKHLFTAIGTIENGDTILCFMPMAQAERLREQPGRISRERVKDLPMEAWKNKGGEDSPFYKPDLGTNERDGEVLSGGIQPDVQST